MPGHPDRRRLNQSGDKSRALQTLRAAEDPGLQPGRYGTSVSLYGHILGAECQEFPELQARAVKELSRIYSINANPHPGPLSRACGTRERENLSQPLHSVTHQ